MAYAADTWLMPIVLTPDTDNVLVVTEDPGGSPNVITVTFHQDTASTAEETWYHHDDSTFHGTRPGLLYALQKLLNDGTTVGCGTVSGSPTYTYSVEVADPASSTGLTNNGLTLRATAPGTDFEVSWTHASTTIDATIFGATDVAPISDHASATDGADEVVNFPYATRYRMVTRDLLDGIAEDKRRFHYKDSWRSTTRPKDAVSVVWDEGFIRRFLYREVPGVEVHQDRAKQSAWASTTSRATNDNHAVWYEAWDALTDDLEVIVVHNTSSDLQVDANDYEVCKLWQETPWEQMFRQTSPGGDLYDVAVSLWVDTDNASYDH